MNRIRMLREKNKMTQADLGKMLNVKDAAISKYESGKILLTAETIIRLTEIFHVSSDYLLGITDVEGSGSCVFAPEAAQNNNAPVVQYTSVGYWIYKSGLTKEAVAQKLHISLDIIDSYCNSTVIPPQEHLAKLCRLCGTSTDCLLGLNRTAGRIQAACPDTAVYDPKTSGRLKHLFQEQGFTYQKAAQLLGLQEEDIFDLVEYGRIPQVSILPLLAKALHSSTDYILNLSDSKISMTSECEPICTAVRKLNSYNYAIAYAEILKLVKEEERER